jgi:cytochrome c peroxidase
LQFALIKVSKNCAPPQNLGGAGRLDLSAWVPTLRNIALTAPYFHNGLFTTLEQVVQWYVTRDLNNNTGNNPAASGVHAQEINDRVALLCTLTDGYDPANPAAYSAPTRCQMATATTAATTAS